MAAQRYFAVKNLERFQHYKDRRPPWIKLYQDVLEDYGFTCLPDASKMHLLAIWLLASRTENRVPYDPEWIATTIHATQRVDLDALLSAGFITLYQNDSDPLATCPVSAMPETEVEAETEKGVAGATIIGVVMGETAQCAMQLTAAANRATRQKWRAEPYVQGSTQSYTLAEEVLQAGVPIPEAVQRITDLIDACGLPQPPRSIRYFLPGITQPNTPKVRAYRRGDVGDRSYQNAKEALGSD